MAGFPKEWLSELLSKSDIVDVLSDYLTLTKKGSRYWSFCPFHHEKNASFNVNPDRQMFYCFSCHRGGGVINFIMEHEKLTFPEAVAILAERAGMEMPAQGTGEDYAKKRQQEERLHSLLKEAALYYHANLQKKENAHAAAYLAGRGIGAPIIRRFGLGYARDSYDDVTGYLKSRGYTMEEMMGAGMARQKNGKVYDVFRDRVMFPIVDTRSRVIGFGGRVMGEGEPKYLNSMETAVFNKRHNLYGLNLVRSIKNLKSIIVVEGYMDTISLSAAGVRPVVASLGTALTREQARLIKRYVSEVFLSYDGDTAGVRASIRGIDILSGEGLKVRVVSLPGGLDPDDFIRKYGRDAYAKQVRSALPGTEYKLIRMSGEYNLGNPDDVVVYATEASRFLSGLPNEIEKERYVSWLSEKTRISPESIRAQMQSVKKDAPMYNLGINELNSHKTEESGVEAALIALLLDDPELIRYCEGKVGKQDFENENYGSIFLEIQQAIKRGILPTCAEILSLYAERPGFNSELILSEPPAAVADKHVYLDSLINKLLIKGLDRQKSALLKRQAEVSDEVERAALLKEIDRLNKKIYAYYDVERK